MYFLSQMEISVRSENDNIKIITQETTLNLHEFITKPCGNQWEPC